MALKLRVQRDRLNWIRWVPVIYTQTSAVDHEHDSCLCVFVQLVSYGFPLDVADSALRLMGDDLEQATQMLLDYQGAVPPELLSPSPPSSSSEEPSTSSDSTGETTIHIIRENTQYMINKQGKIR